MKKSKNISMMSDEYDDQFDSEITPGIGRPPSRLSRKQISKNLQRLVDNEGQWDTQKSGWSMLPGPLPAEAWESIGMTAPDAAVAACRAVDLASSMKYFEVFAAGNEKKQEIANDVGAMARLTTMMAAASGLISTKDVLTDAEKERYGIVDGASLPNPEMPLT